MSVPYRRSAGFFFARGLLGVCLLSSLLAIIGAVLPVLSGDDVIREMANRRRSVQVDDPSLGLSVLDAAPAVLLGLVVLVTSWLLLVVVVDIQRGVPFEQKAARRLRVAAYAVVIGVIGHAGLSGWADIRALDEAGRRGESFLGYVVGGLFDSSQWWLVAALLAVFAHAFGEGRRLTDDSEGLV